MLLALDFVRRFPGSTKYAVAKAIGAPFVDPAHSPGALYETIDRCIAAGFLDAELADGRRYSLTITASGLAELARKDQK